MFFNSSNVMMGILVAIIFYNSFMLFRNGIQTDLVKIHLACIVAGAVVHASHLIGVSKLLVIACFLPHLH